MKKAFSILAWLSVVFSTPVHADPYYEHRYYRERHSDNWVAPLLGGVIIGAILTDNRRRRYTEPRSYYPALVCKNVYVRDRYGNYILDQEGRAVFTQQCWYQQDE